MNDTFINFESYKGAESKTYFYEIQTQLQKLDSMVNTSYSAPLLETSTNTPVFLIGFPKSGTTLLDTILRSHSNIEVVEEQDMVAKTQHYLGNTMSLADIEKLTTKELAKHVSNAGSSCIVDKFPLNIFDVPIIHKLFPRAKFILALRYPLELSEKHYALDIHRIRYEDLVLDMKSEVSNLLRFLELDWENALEDY